MFSVLSGYSWEAHYFLKGYELEADLGERGQRVEGKLEKWRKGKCGQYVLKRKTNQTHTHTQLFIIRIILRAYDLGSYWFLSISNTMNEFHYNISIISKSSSKNLSNHILPHCHLWDSMKAFACYLRRHFFSQGRVTICNSSGCPGTLCRLSWHWAHADPPAYVSQVFLCFPSAVMCMYHHCLAVSKFLISMNCSWVTHGNVMYKKPFQYLEERI